MKSLVFSVALLYAVVEITIQESPPVVEGPVVERPLPEALKCDPMCINHWRNCDPVGDLEPDRVVVIDCSDHHYQLKCPLFCEICTPCTSQDLSNLENRMDDISETIEDLDDKITELQNELEEAKEECLSCNGGENGNGGENECSGDSDCASGGICKNGQCEYDASPSKITHVTIMVGAADFARFTDSAQYGPNGNELGKMTFTLLNGDKKCGCSTNDIKSNGFLIERNQLYDYDVDFDCPDFQIQDEADVTHFRIETNSGDATKLSYVALIVNGIEFRVDDNEETTFQVADNQHKNKSKKEDAVISKDYPLYKIEPRVFE